MNLEPETLRYFLLVLGFILFPVREYFIRKRIIKIHAQLREKVPDHSNTIDLTGLQPVIKYSSTEQVLSKIEVHLNKLK